VPRVTSIGKGELCHRRGGSQREASSGAIDEGVTQVSPGFLTLIRYLNDRHLNVHAFRCVAGRLPTIAEVGTRGTRLACEARSTGWWPHNVDRRAGQKHSRPCPELSDYFFQDKALNKLAWART